MEHHVVSFDVGGGLTLYLGPDMAGVDLEVGTVERNQATVVVHTMKLRAQFVDEYRRHLPWPR